ncbi:MAG TPA: hypothetical protein VI757_00325 [Bacteroidia bacterium]|nr:hypothetical protein [Bacteroidia bacterium]
MKKTLLISTLAAAAIFASNNTSAQRAADIGFSSGITEYFGDLGNDNGVIPWSSTNVGFAVTLRNFLNHPRKSGMMYTPFSVEARLSWHRIGYDETAPISGMAGGELRNYYRGINFRNDVFGTAAHLTYTYYPNKFQSLYRQKFCVFGFAGVGAFYGRPKSDLFRGSADMSNRYFIWGDGTLRDAPERSGHGNIVSRDGSYETDLYKWHTEGQGDNLETGSRPEYSLVNIAFPSGFGVRYGLSKLVSLSAEFAYYYFLTDYLDDVSDRYATSTEIKRSFPDDISKQQLATYISDPSGRGTDGTVLMPPSSRRGNPKLNDSYTYISLEVAYRFKFKRKEIYGAVAHK